MKFLFLNVQSPPEPRSARLLDALLHEQPEVLVLSELSSGAGSQTLANGVAGAGYITHWIRPPRYDYAVLLAIRHAIPHRPLEWSAEYGVGRARFVMLRNRGVEMIVGGVYAPSLNRENLTKREAFFQSMNCLLAQAVSRGSIVVFGGDVNEVPPWHIPQIESFAAEGYPFHSRLAEVGLIDLAHTALPPRTYSWFDREGVGQLLDGAFISAQHAGNVVSYRIDDTFLTQHLSDHCGLRMEISFESAIKSD